MNEKHPWSLWRKCLLTIGIYVMVLLVFYALVGKQLHWRPSEINNDTINSTVGEFTADRRISQVLENSIDEIHMLTVPFATFGRTNSGNLWIEIEDIESETILWNTFVDVSTIEPDENKDFSLHGNLQNIAGQTLAIHFYSDGLLGQSVGIYADSRPIYESQSLLVNGTEIPGVLAIRLQGGQHVNFTGSFLLFSAATTALLTMYCSHLLLCERRGRNSVGLSVIRAFDKYRFLLKQLIARDFKTKYKRSFLGILWSFLNPLITMLVQYLVFSMIFQQNIANFPVYLLIGVVFFNFFSDACNIGIGSIIDNSTLITKVYIPKYIFPISKVLSSSINLLLSFLPLLLVMLLTGTYPKANGLLLVFPLVCILLFCLGMSMLLSSIMVFFRDIRFIWSVVSMLWMYITPIFYPESIIPQQLQFIIRLNPVYHVIRFSRTVILEGVSPIPRAYLFCLFAAIGPLIAGVIVFKKTQDKFILHI